MTNAAIGSAGALARRTVCVDLDGTVIAGDVLWESFISLVKRRPLKALLAFVSLAKGRASFKRQVATHSTINPAALPYRRNLLDHLDDQLRRGARLVLVTASDETYAHAVAVHLGIFEDVIASDGQTNLSGERKASVLASRYGQGGFTYIGNHWSDVPVWQAAGDGTAVGVSPRLARHVVSQQLVSHVIDARRGWLPRVWSALRPHQWVKNVLVFLPMIAAHTVGQPPRWSAAALTFVAFSLCASAIYVLNDISDIEADRLHPRKRTRPFASGDLSIPAGGALSMGLILLSLAVAVLGVSWRLAGILVVYLFATSAYSLCLKRQAVLDVFTLTGLYMLRVVAGGIATATPLSSWFLAFILFGFLSLAFVKRYAELVTIQDWMPGRGYGPQDAIWMHAIGTSAGYMAVVVLALYMNSPEVSALYRRPQALWLLCPLLLFWLTRLWFRAGRRVLHDDPVIEALKDSATYVVLAIAFVAILMAL